MFMPLPAETPFQAQEGGFDECIGYRRQRDRDTKTEYHKDPVGHMDRRQELHFCGKGPVDERHRHMVEIDAIADGTEVLHRLVAAKIAGRAFPAVNADQDDGKGAATKAELAVEMPERHVIAEEEEDGHEMGQCNGEEQVPP